MKLEELADFIDTEIDIRFNHYTSTYQCDLKRVEFKDSKEDSCISGIFGRGASPSLAREDYIRRIRGKLLVINSGSREKRREYNVPHTLECNSPEGLLLYNLIKDKVKLKYKWLFEDVIKIVVELDPECPDAEAYIDGYCSLYELVMSRVGYIGRVI